MPNYELQTKEYVSYLDPQVQPLAIRAIDDCLAVGKDWRWICTALNKKSYSNWNRWKFGLLFSKNFDESVKETMRREDEALDYDVEDFLSDLDCRHEYLFPEQKAVSNEPLTKEVF